MAFAASGAGHQYGGGGQYKSGNHHGQTARGSHMAFMAQMSNSQLLAYGDTLQEIKEEEESVVQDMTSNGLAIKQFLKIFSRKKQEGDTAPGIKETDNLNNRSKSII